MSRPPKWNSPTESVRLPKHAIEACVALARAMDQPLPAEATDPEFAAYMRFVRNLKPYLIQLDERRYLLRLDHPPSFEEWKELNCLEKLFFEQCDRNRLRPEVVFGKLVERILKPMREAG